MSAEDDQITEEQVAAAQEEEPKQGTEEPVAPLPDDPAADTDGPSDDDVVGNDDTDDEDDDEQPADEPAPPPPAPDTEAQLDKITTALSKAARTYGNRVAAIFGDDWQGCIPCPLCATDFPGVLTPAPRSDEVVAAVRPIIGLPDLTTYREDRFARTCERCDGRGKTLTGSRVPEYATMRCPECQGSGFKSAEQSAPAPVHTNGYDAPPLPTHVEDAPVPAMPQASIDALEKMLEAARNQGVAG